jgi:hypothetical protein
MNSFLEASHVLLAQSSSHAFIPVPLKMHCDVISVPDIVKGVTPYLRRGVIIMNIKLGTWLPNCANSPKECSRGDCQPNNRGSGIPKRGVGALSVPIIVCFR